MNNKPVIPIRFFSIVTPRKNAICQHPHQALPMGWLIGIGDTISCTVMLSDCDQLPALHHAHSKEPPKGSALGEIRIPYALGFYSFQILWIVNPVVQNNEIWLTKEMEWCRFLDTLRGDCILPRAGPFNVAPVLVAQSVNRSVRVEPRSLTKGCTSDGFY